MLRALRSFWLLCCCAGSVGLPAHSAQAQGEALPPCHLRPLQVENFKPIWVDIQRFCIERVLALPEGEDDELALTAIAFGAVGDEEAWFAASPLAGEIWRFTDQDGDGLPDASSRQVILRDLHRPNALAWQGGALYVVAGAEFLRWFPDGRRETLVDDLPTGAGIWNGGLAFDDRGTAYVGSGAPCALCTGDEVSAHPAPRASILRIPPGGSWEIYATGIRQPAGLAWAQGSLWATDTRPAHQAEMLYRIQPGADYGWPRCHLPELPCENTAPAALTLPANSVPLALWHYQGAAFPQLAGNLLLALAGNPHLPVNHHGFALAAVSLSDLVSSNPEAPLSLEYLVPHPPGAEFKSREAIALLNTGIWPRRIFSATADERGWIYFSLSGGQIYVLRPP